MRQVDVIVAYGAFRDEVVHGEATGMVGDVEADGLCAEVTMVLIARSSDVQCVVAGFSDRILFVCFYSITIFCVRTTFPSIKRKT